MTRHTGRKPGLQTDGPRIRQIREGHGLTPTETARRMGPGRSPEAILITEKYSRRISRVYAAQLARALSIPGEPVTVADLLAEDDGSEPEVRPRVA